MKFTLEFCFSSKWKPNCFRDARSHSRFLVCFGWAWVCLARASMNLWQVAHVRPRLSSKAAPGTFGSAVRAVLTLITTTIFCTCWTGWKRGFKVRVTPCPLKSPFYGPSHTLRNESLSSPPETDASTACTVHSLRHCRRLTLHPQS